MRIFKSAILMFLLSALWIVTPAIAQNNNNPATNTAEQEKEHEMLQKAKIEAAKKEIEITARSVDISKFPEIKVVIEAYNKLGEPLDTLSADNLFVYEDGVSKKVLKVEKIPIAEKTAVDFVFCIDKTGSMQQNINAVRSNISSFTKNLAKRGIDYTLSLVLFSDDLERIEQPTTSLVKFLDWLSGVTARGGGDEPENALEALKAATKMKFRKEANKVVVLVTDAPYHQKGMEGDGVTGQTTKSIIELLQKNEVRLFSIVPQKLTDYAVISKATRGTCFDIDYPFSTILDNFSNQLTNIFALTYRSDKTAMPDSIEIALFNPSQKKLVRKTIPIVELGRKLIIENLLFETNKYELPDNVNELNLMAEFMLTKPNIVIMIEGHTDNIGLQEKNQSLSENRAEAVKKYLMKRGITEDRILTKGYGHSKPIASNKNEFGRKLNRRTEIIIVSK